MITVTKGIAMIADAVILGFTLQKTIHIFGMDRALAANNKVTTILAYNGNTQLLLESSRLIFDVLIGSIQFGQVVCISSFLSY